MKIFLDVDGVLADFVGGTARLLGFNPAVVTCWDYYGQAGTTEDKFWRAVDDAGMEFWRELDEYPWAMQLTAECHKRGRTKLLTTPSNHWSSTAGKLLWMQDRFGSTFRGYLMGAGKEDCANRSSVLIDDSDTNCNKFRESGGSAILFPRPWNENRHLAADPFSYTISELDDLEACCE